MNSKTYEQRLDLLKISSIQRRKDRGTILFMQRMSQLDPSLAGLPPLNGARYKEINFHVFGHSYSSAQWSKDKSFIDRVYQNSISYVGPRLYNAIPPSIRSSSPSNIELGFDKIKKKNG